VEVVAEISKIAGPPPPPHSSRAILARELASKFARVTTTTAHAFPRRCGTFKLLPPGEPISAQQALIREGQGYAIGHSHI
jgi:hypothetical protein